jgi:thioredoxin 1
MPGRKVFMRKLWIMVGCALLLSACGPSERTGPKVEPTALSEENFEKEVLLSKEPVLVDFWAAWCGPCLEAAPMMEELAGEFVGKVKFAKLDVDEAPALAGKYGVSSLPTFIIFKDGEVLSRRRGLPATDAKGKFSAWIQSSLE